jgi:hypothetical protein
MKCGTARKAIVAVLTLAFTVSIASAQAKKNLHTSTLNESWIK